MYTRCGGVAAYHVVCMGLCLWSVRVCVFLPVLWRWSCACIDVNNWVILLRAGYKYNHFPQIIQHPPANRAFATWVQFCQPQFKFLLLLRFVTLNFLWRSISISPCHDVGFVLGVGRKKSQLRILETIPGGGSSNPTPTPTSTSKKSYKRHDYIGTSLCRFQYVWSSWTIILPFVMYGCATWSRTSREERRLRVFENRVLRRIFGPKKDEVIREWRGLHNEELNDLYYSRNIVRVIKSRMRWARHVARMRGG